MSNDTVADLAEGLFATVGRSEVVGWLAVSRRLVIS